MSAATHTKEDANALRRQLLIELSVLRRRYTQLANEDHINRGETSYPHQGTHRDVEASVSSCASSSYSPSNRASCTGAAGVAADDGGDVDSGALCQSDRDAIEALFHSIDDFTRDFNEGKGDVDRDDIVARIVRGNV
jgi:hypothetical protein